MATPKRSENIVRCGVIGYAMGAAHAYLMSETKGLQVAAICDLDEAKLEKARQDYPKARTYADVTQMLDDGVTDLVAVVVPHYLHAELAIQCARAGQHVVVEKPMAITVQQCTDMIEAAKRAGTMLSVFHQRRWDGDYLATREVVDKGLIGDVFHVEHFWGGYWNPSPRYWRSKKDLSGGILYDLGAHCTDWSFGLIPEKIESVTGYLHRRRGDETLNEDQGQVLIRFESGAVADFQISGMARAQKAWRRVLGTVGATLQEHENDESIKVFTEIKRIAVSMEVKCRGEQRRLYYQSIADHLLKGKALAVTGEQGRRVIAVIEAAQRSAACGGAEQVEFEG